MLARLLRASFVTSLLLISSSLAFSGETVIQNFTTSTGINPSGGLLMDSAGNFYGTGLDGTLFEFSANGSGGWKYNVLCKCSATYGYGSLVMDASGNLYSASYWGQIYEYSPGGSSGWVQTLLYSFTGPAGSGPSPLVMDAQRNLYGIYGSGGAHNKGFVFKLAQGSNGSWTLSHLHDFTGTDGASYAENNAYAFIGGLVFDKSGNLFGTANQGGSSTSCSGGCGVVFELQKGSSSWTYKMLHSFTGTDGSNPDAALVMDSAGNLYGTTTAGGSKGFGVAFEIAAGTWHNTVLYNFTNANGDGAYPNSTLLMDSTGNLYGTTEAGGGSDVCNVWNVMGCGTVFKLAPSGSTYKESVLVKFSGKSSGGFPGGVTLGQDQNLYGVDEVGGTSNRGLFFEVPR